MSKKIYFPLFLLSLIMAFVHTSYAAAPACNFTAGGDSTISYILAGGSSGKPCPATTMPGQLLSMVGICPSNAISQAQAACTNQPQANREACQKLYMGAYYGKLQAACNYLVNVQQADANYKAPPPLSGITTP